MVERTKAFTMLLIGTLAWSGCASSREPGDGVMGNTNWLRQCGDDGDCGDDLSCVCGVCTRECEEASACDGLDGAACGSGSLLVLSGSGTCDTPGVPNVCLPACSSASDCGSGYECIASHCLPVQPGGGEPPPVNVELGSQACGPSGVFASIHVAPDEACLIPTEGGRNVPTGTYDIRGALQGSAACSAGYQLAVLVESCLRGEGDILQIHSAQVTLMDQSRAMIVFDRDELVLPNPFLVTTNAVLDVMDGERARTIVVVDAIPPKYAAQLESFAGDSIVVELQIFGTTRGGADIDVRPFVYGIQICDGCLTVCIADIPPETPLETVYGSECPDNAGADGRICVDSGPNCR